MHRKHRAAEASLSAFWNAVGTGQPSIERARRAGEIDPDQARTIEWAHAAHVPHRPDSGFVVRLEADLLAGYARPAAPAATPTPVGGRPREVRRAAAPARRIRVGSRLRWVSAQLGAALLVVVTLAGIYLSLRDQPHQATLAPSPTASPSPNTDVPIARGGIGRTGEFPGHGPRQAPARRWAFVGETGSISAPAIVDGVIYVSSDGGTVYALDERTGQERWRFDGGTSIFNVPTVVDGTVFVGGKLGIAYALDANTGAERWRFQTNGLIRAVILPIDDLVIVASADGNVYALDRATGAERWRAATGDDLGALALGAGLAIAASDHGALHAIDLATHTERWHAGGPGSDGWIAAVAGTTVYATEHNVGLHAFDVATGAERWSYPSAAQRDAPSISGDTLVAQDQNGLLVALDAATGAERWKIAMGAPNHPPAIADGIVYAGAQNGGITAVDLTTGATLWRQPKPPVSAGPVIANGMLFVSSAGIVIAYGEPDGGTPVTVHARPATPSARAGSPTAVSDG